MSSQPEKRSGRCHVLIVGCGLSGLATAIAISKSGHSVTIFERAPALREIGAGIQVPPNAARLFAKWSPQLMAAIRARAYTAPTGYLRSWRGAVLAPRADMARVEALFGAPYLNMHRADLLNALADEARALGVNILLGAQVLSRDPTFPSVKLADGRKFFGSVLFATDGERSTFRATLPGGPATRVESSGHAVYRIAVPRAAAAAVPELREIVERPSTNIWLGADGHVVSYLLPNDILNMAIIRPDTTRPSGDGQVAPGAEKVVMDEIRAAYAEWDPLLRAILALPALDCHKWPLLRWDELESWVDPESRFALMGDAAHGMPPYLAQGAAQAFEDAAVLGTLFRDRTSRSEIPTLLATYQRIRQPRAAEMRRRTFAQREFFQLPDGPRQRARDRELARGMLGMREGHPNALYDPVVQRWMWGYDAVRDAEGQKDPFVGPNPKVTLPLFSVLRFVKDRILPLVLLLAAGAGSALYLLYWR